MSLKTLFQTDLTDISSTDVEGVGTLRWVGDNLYRWVQNAEAATALTVGQVCCHDISDGADMLESVEIPATADLGALAGVVMATSLTAQYYGWIQVLGYTASVSVTNTTNVAVAAGDYLKGVNAAAYATRDAATQPLYVRNIQVLEAYATHTTPSATFKKGLINCLG